MRPAVGLTLVEAPCVVHANITAERYQEFYSVFSGLNEHRVRPTPRDLWTLAEMSIKSRNY
jgi:hypothetical protein